MQKPPLYSAVKVDGKRLYKYARQGKEVKVPEREINISDFSLLNIDGAVAEFIITVSKGTYIRSLILDLAVKLDTTAVVTEILRTHIGKLSVEDNKFIKDVNELKKEEQPDPIHWSKILDFPIVKIDKEMSEKILHGELLNSAVFDGSEMTIMEYSNQIAALYKPFNDNFYKPEKVLL